MSIKFEISTQDPAPHRGTFFSEFISNFGSRMNEIPVFIVKLHRDQNWWIVPAMYTDDDLIGDTGPYETPEDAMLMLKLLSD